MFLDPGQFDFVESLESKWESSRDEYLIFRRRSGSMRQV
jgi:hypothetical protein